MQPLSQHRSRRGQAPGGVPETVLLGEHGASAKVPQWLTRPSWAARPLVTVPVRSASSLAALARAKRNQLATLAAAGVTASLHWEVEGRTRLASLLPARESSPGSAALRGARRVFTLQRPRSLAVFVERS
jgi:hypothetical protein